MPNLLNINNPFTPIKEVPFSKQSTNPSNVIHPDYTGPMYKGPLNPESSAPITASETSQSLRPDQPSAYGSDLGTKLVSPAESPAIQGTGLTELVRRIESQEAVDFRVDTKINNPNIIFFIDPAKQVDTQEVTLVDIEAEICSEQDEE